MRMSLVVALLALLAAACGPGGQTPTSDSPESSASSTSTLPAVTSTSSVPPAPATTSGPGVTSTTRQQVDVEFRSGEVFGPPVFELEVGQTVDVWVLSDVDDEIHVHGYDLFVGLKAGEPRQVNFVADVPGIFEVEVHTGHIKLFDLEVSG